MNRPRDPNQPAKRSIGIASGDVQEPIRHPPGVIGSERKARCETGRTCARRKNGKQRIRLPDDQSTRPQILRRRFSRFPAL
jgi:hypothetical protein